AHPKIESSTGDLISFGLTQELSPQFKIYKISKKQKIFQEIHSLKLGGFYPVHDMAQSEDYLVFLVPPVKVNLWGAAFGRKPIADLIESDDKKNLQLLVAPKNAKSPPIMLDTNIKNMNFHHVRAWQEGRFLFLDSFLIEDDSIYQTFKSWSSSLPTNSPHSKLVRFQIDLNTKKLQVIITLSEPTKSDFPVLLEEGRFVAISVSQSSSDSLGFNQILLWDQSSGSILKKLELSPGEVLSEVLPCQNYLVHLGYSLHQNESFLDIRDEKSLQRISRVWLGNSHPLGFHGFFNQV
ncbi:MAG: carotenoid oxygenase family protein, partial [Bdellovibrionales bacterium]